MKKTILLAMTLFSMTGWGMAQFPEQAYNGKGLWKDSSGKTGKYHVRMVATGTRLSGVYDYSGKRVNSSIEAKFNQHGGFDVSVSNKPVGHGYCLSVQCHYSLNFGEVVLEETVTFLPGRAYRIGSKLVGDTKVYWEEEYTAIDLEQ